MQGHCYWRFPAGIPDAGYYQADNQKQDDYFFHAVFFPGLLCMTTLWAGRLVFSTIYINKRCRGVVEPG
jgi:hypothetical protein